MIHLTDHARARLEKRRIELVWVEEVVSDPGVVLADEDDPDLEHRIGIVPGADFRILRVVCRVESESALVITAFFDPDSRGLL